MGGRKNNNKQNQSFESLSTDDKLNRLYTTIRAEAGNNSKNFSDISSDIKSIKNNIDAMEARVDRVDKKYVRVTDEIQQLKRTVNDLQQSALLCDVIIRGVVEVEQNKDELLTIVQLIIAKVNCQQVVSICLIRRMGRTIEGKKSTRPILVTLNSRDEKKSLMAAKRKVQLNCSQIEFENKVIGTNQQTIYFDEHLTKTTNGLCYIARQLRKRQILKHWWVRDGLLFIRRKDGVDAIRIEDKLQLKTLTKPPVKRKLNSTPINPDLNMSVDGEEDSTVVSPSTKKNRDNSQSESSDDDVEEIVDPNAAGVGGNRPQRIAKG